MLVGIIVGVVLFGLGVAVIFRPGLAGALAVGLIVSNILVSTRAYGMPTPASLLPYVLLFGSAFVMVALRRRPVVVPGIALALMLVILSGTSSAVVSDYAGGTVGVLAEWIIEGALFVIVLSNTIRTREDLRRCIEAGVIAASAIGALVLVQNFTGQFWQDFYGLATVSEPYDVTGASFGPLGGEGVLTYRSSGMIGEPNFFAMYMSTIVPWALFLAYTSKRWLFKALWVAAAVLILVGVLYSYSRGALVAAAAAVVILSVIGVLPRRTLIWAGLGGAAIAAIMPTLRERLLTLIGVGSSIDNSNDASSRGRLSELIAAWRTLLEHPWLGVGPGQFPNYYQRYGGDIGGGAHTGAGGRQSHNLLMGLAADMGLLGILAWVGLFTVAFVGLAAARRTSLHHEAVCVITSLTVFLTASVFLHLAFARYLWLLFGMASLVVLIAARSVNQGHHAQTEENRVPTSRTPAPVA